MARSLAGLRIRERRMALGLTQADLARRAGISPSYLNLIEKNRRAAAGRVLLGLARALDVAPSALVEGPERALIDGLAEVAAARGADPGRAEELVGRFPDWARALAGIADENRSLREAVAALGDRLTHDPFLGQSVHRMLTNLTAIRSTTDILTEATGLDPDRRARFLRIIAEETGRLSAVVQDLVAYFDRAGTDPAAAATPEEALDRFLAAHDHHFPGIDENPSDPARREAILAAAGLEDAGARQLARAHLDRYAADAALMPLQPFAGAAAQLGHHPLRLADAFAAPPLAVFRRLATLARPGLQAPPFACLQMTAAGHVEMRRTRPGLSLPRHGTACPLWPIFDALAQPGLPVARMCRLPDDSRILALALAAPTSPPALADRPRLRAGMLLLTATEPGAEGLAAEAEAAGPERRVGPGCRLCPRADCPERAVPSLLG
ncbi:MAG: XRE family transcriptional regulator [Paracoccaceae bacterium]|nr:MAG: helix-turn-helix domain-containing protein [Alphaproteobacteria bacterium]GIX14452.1 MAG: XRE family transcriptional regulator [Paracoccaceae bacterium]